MFAEAKWCRRVSGTDGAMMQTGVHGLQIGALSREMRQAYQHGDMSTRVTKHAPEQDA